MAAYSNCVANGNIRVRLYFDYPPPAVVDSRMCWLLVDLSTCRVVADLESIIKDRFEFSHGTIINLFIEDCYLPHTESVYVVRDNDSVRVKVHCLTQVNGHQRPTEQDGESTKRILEEASDDERKSQGKPIGKKKKKKKKSKKTKAVADKPKAAASTKKILTSVENPVKCTDVSESQEAPVWPVVHCLTQVNGQDSSPGKNCRKRQRATEQDGESTKRKKHENSKILEEASHDDRKSQDKPIGTKKKKKNKKSKKTEAVADKPKAAASTNKILTSVENPVKCTVKPTAKTQNMSSGLSSPLTIPPKHKPLTTASPKDVSESQEAPPVLQSTGQTATAAPCSSGSEEEMELANQAQTEQPGRGPATQGSGRGYGRGHTWLGDPGDLSSDGDKVSSNQKDSLTNTSVVLQNGAAGVTTKDYSSMPLLAAPPQAGQKIAFKLLELTENYTPEVSEYKEGKILSFDPTTKQIELELLHVSEAPTEPGKFDLVYQNPDGTERVEYAVSRDAWVTELWDSLLEPRLIL